MTKFVIFQDCFCTNLIQIRENQTKKTLCIQIFLTQCNSLVLLHFGKYCEPKLHGKLVNFYDTINEQGFFISTNILIVLIFQESIFSQVSFEIDFIPLEQTFLKVVLIMIFCQFSKTFRATFFKAIQNSSDIFYNILKFAKETREVSLWISEYFSD